MNKEQMINTIKTKFRSWEGFTKHCSASPQALCITGWRMCKAMTTDLHWLVDTRTGEFIYAKDVLFTKTLSYDPNYEYIYTDSYRPAIVTASDVLRGYADVKVYY